MRAALYARFSSDLQNPRSIDDQLALCREHCARQGLTVKAEFSDRAMSGASLVGRAGIAALMDAARAGAFDVVIVEALDRLSRDQEDLAGLYKRLKFVGVEIHAVHDGKADEIQIGVRSIVGALYLVDLGNKVRRAAMGRVRAGKLPGGLSYGYRATPGAPGLRAIDPDQAAIVRRIFADYLAGMTPRDIAKALNAEGIAPPRGGTTWNASTINGSRSRGNGILHNRLFRGEIVWNRLRMVKDPDTGRRVSRANDAGVQLSSRAPHLAIVDDDTFAAVQAAAESRARPKAGGLVRPRYAFSGLLGCGTCGGSLVRGGTGKTGRPRLVCSRRRESGSCENARVYDAHAIEAQALSALERELRHPKLIEEYAAAYEAERKRLAGDRAKERGEIERRIGETRRAIARLVDALADGSVTGAAIGERLQALESEQAALADRLARLQEHAPMVTLHPAAVRLYLRQVEDLAATLNDVGAKAWINVDSAAGRLRSLIDRVIVHPRPPGEPPRLEIRGRLAELVAVPGMSSGCDSGGSSGRI